MTHLTSAPSSRARTLKRAAVLAAIGLVAPSAWAQRPPGFREVAGTSRVQFFSRDGANFGGRQQADVKRTEAFLVRMEKALAQPLAGPITYYRHERPEDIAAQTGVYAYGLTRVGDSVVHSTTTYHPHELVHVVAGGLGDPGRFFHEGLAVALGDEGTWNGRAVETVARAQASTIDAKALLTAFDRLPSNVAYPVAGSVVKHLIARNGVARLVEFFRACPRATDVEAAFLRTYGRSLSEEFEDWRLEFTT